LTLPSENIKFRLIILEYEQNYKTSQGEDHPDVGKPFKWMRFDEDRDRKMETPM